MCNVGRDADEATLFELLVASERIGKWLDSVRNRDSGWNAALRELRKAVEEHDAYAEEAWKGGAIGTATAILRHADAVTDGVLDDAARVIAICSGPAAVGAQERTLRYGSISVRVREGSLGDGLGTKVWASAHMLAERLVKCPEFVRGRHVLELGSGCGLTGILAAKLGAAQVTLTDCVPAVLTMLAASVALNMQCLEDAADDSTTPPQVDEDMSSWDPEDADSCDSAAELFSPSVADGAHHAAAAGSLAKAESDLDASTSCNQDCIRIRHYDWAESVRHLDGVLDSDIVGIETAAPASCQADTQTTSRSDGAMQTAPTLPPDEQFEVIIGSDLVYEHGQAQLLAAALAHRLVPGGRAMLVCPVRDESRFVRCSSRIFRAQALFRELDRHLLDRHLCRAGEQVGIPAGQAGIDAARRDYEGSFRLMQISKADCED